MKLVNLAFLVLNFSISAVAAEPAFNNCEQFEVYIAQKQWLIDAQVSDLRLEAIPGNTGVNNDGIYVGSLRGKSVFVKRLNLKGETFDFAKQDGIVMANEAVFYSHLHTIALTPKFFGIVRLGHAAYGLVNEFIPNTWLAKSDSGSNNQLPLALRSTEPSVHKLWKVRMKEVVEVLNEQGVRASDLQFLLTRDGKAYLIDVEAFSYVEKGRDLQSHNANQLQTIIDQIP